MVVRVKLVGAAVTRREEGTLLLLLLQLLTVVAFLTLSFYATTPTTPLTPHGYHDHLRVWESDLPSADTSTTTISSITTTPPSHNLSEMHKQRFRFIHGKIKVNLTAPKVNLIPEHVRWRHPLNQATPCHDGSSQPLVLALVPSAPGNRRGRNFIRSTWAHPALYPRTGLKVLFVVGLTQDAELQDALDTEAALFHDLIQNTFVDSYRNLTYKAISWLSWVSQHCTHVPFIAKVDDDVLVNPYCLGKYLRGLFSVTTPKTPASNDTLASPPRLSTSSSNQQLSLSVNSTGSLSDDGSLSLTPTDYIYGRLQTRSSPHRRGKWSLAIEEYPENIFPPFVLGPAYIVGAHAVRRLLKYVAQTPFLWLEDVFTTGLVAHLAHVPHVQTEFLYTGNPSVELFYGQKAFMTETSEDKRRYGWEGIKKFSHTEDNHKS